MTKVLGIDPGLDRTGWAVLERDRAGRLLLCAAGLIHTSKEMGLPHRLEYIFNEVQKLAETYGPSVVAMEEMFFMKRAMTVSYTIQTRGVIVLASHIKGLGIISYPPKKVKSVICGSGTADKKQVQRMVELTLNLTKPLNPDDVADAAAIAICHLKTSGLAGIIKTQNAFLEKLKAARKEQIK